MLVALTRESGRNEQLRRWVGSRARVVEVPLTFTCYRPVDDVANDVRASRHFGRFHALVATSSRVEPYVDVATESLIKGAMAYSVGARTTAMLEDHGLSVAYQSTGTSVEVAPRIDRGPVLVLGAVNGRDELVDLLQSRHLDSRLVRCYETKPVVLDEEAMDSLRNANVVFIGAPSAWRVAREVVARDAWVLVPGTTTLNDVRSTHERSLVGWGEDFERAWRVVIDSDA